MHLVAGIVLGGMILLAAHSVLRDLMQTGRVKSAVLLFGAISLACVVALSN